MQTAPSSKNRNIPAKDERKIIITGRKTPKKSTKGSSLYSGLYEKIFNSLPLPVFVKDRQHRWILINDSLCEMQETSRDYLLNNTDHDLFPKEQADELFKLEEEIFQTRKPLFIEEFTTRNGHDSYVLIKKSVITDDKNNDYIVGGCIDITERKKIELAIQESEKRFRSLVQHSPDIIFILENDATIRYVTPSFTRLLGYSEKSVYGSTIYSFIHIDDVFTLQQKLQEISKVPNHSGTLMFKGVRENGDLILLEATISNLADDPSVQGLIINASDITQLRLQADEIQRMNELLQVDNTELKAELKKEVKARFDLKTLDFDEFHKVYPDDESCYYYLANIKWKEGYVCSRCKNDKYSKGKFPHSRRCTLCGFDQSPLKGTIFANQKFSIVKGFYMAFLIASQLKITSKQLSSMVSLRKDTCAVFKRNFLKIYKLQKHNSRSSHQWEKLLILPEKTNPSKK